MLIEIRQRNDGVFAGEQRVLEAHLELLDIGSAAPIKVFAHDTSGIVARIARPAIGKVA
jgi:hypothetical protein